jgi:hypothetical protein
MYKVKDIEKEREKLIRKKTGQFEIDEYIEADVVIDAEIIEVIQDETI